MYKRCRKICTKVVSCPTRLSSSWRWWPLIQGAAHCFNIPGIEKCSIAMCFTKVQRSEVVAKSLFQTEAIYILGSIPQSRPRQPNGQVAVYNPGRSQARWPWHCAGSGSPPSCTASPTGRRQSARSSRAARSRKWGCSRCCTRWIGSAWSSGIPVGWVELKLMVSWIIRNFCFVLSKAWLTWF